MPGTGRRRSGAPQASKLEPEDFPLNVIFEDVGLDAGQAAVLCPSRRVGRETDTSRTRWYIDSPLSRIEIRSARHRLASIGTTSDLFGRQVRGAPIQTFGQFQRREVQKRYLALVFGQGWICTAGSETPYGAIRFTAPGWPNEAPGANRSRCTSVMNVSRISLTSC